MEAIADKSSKIIIQEPRPYWHLDAKWIVGLLLTVTILATLLAYILFKITQREVAIRSTAIIIASLFSPEGLDEAKSFQEAKTKFLADKDQFQPLPGLKIFVTRDDLEQLSPRGIRIKIFSQITQAFYDGGDNGLQQITQEGQSAQELAGSLKLLSPFTQKGHLLIQKILNFSLIINTILLLGLIYFSTRWGKLFSLALIIFLSSFPLTVLLFLIKASLDKGIATSPPTKEALNSVAGYAAANAFGSSVQLLSTQFVRLTLGALSILLLMIIIGSIFKLSRKVFRFTHRGTSNP